MEEITIIGAGASGLMAMAKILENAPQKKITIIERSDKIASKILLTGGGRCNITNAEDDIKKLLKNYPRSQNFLKFALYDFSPKKVMEWFEERGIPLKTEENKRVFPVSNKASSVKELFEKIIKDHDVNLLLNSKPKSVKKQKDHFEIQLNNEKIIKTKKLLITTGGSFNPNPLNLAFGYQTAKNFKHKIIELKAGLTAFLSDETNDLAGLTLKNTNLTLKTKQNYKFKGDLLFTHKGISGPGIFALSSLSADENISKNNPAIIEIDLVPDKNEEELRKKIKEKAENSKSLFSNILSIFINKKIAKIIFPLDKKANEISKKELNQTIEKIKKFKIQISGRVNGEEIVTIGGIDTSEINEKTMESKLCPNLFFAGEILNIDGFTGGFNLQSAWATGKVAGQNI